MACSHYLPAQSKGLFILAGADKKSVDSAKAYVLDYG